MCFDSVFASIGNTPLYDYYYPNYILPNNSFTFCKMPLQAVWSIFDGPTVKFSIRLSGNI